MSEENGQVVLLDRKIDVVTVKLFSDGKTIGKDIGIKSIVVEKEVNKIPTATIVLNDGDPVKRDFILSNDEDHRFEPGKLIEIEAGYYSENKPIFKGVLTKQCIKAGNTAISKLVIECRDVAAKLTVGRKSAFYSETTDSAVMEDILDKYGIEHKIEDTTINYPELVKYYSTDWDFIVSRAEVNGKLVFVNDGVLEVKAPEFEQVSKFALTYGTVIKAFELELDAEEQIPKVQSKAWDFSNQQLLEEEGTFTPPEKGSSHLKSSEFSDVLYQEAGITLYHAGAITTEELQNWADARLMRSRLAKVKGWIRFNGIADIQPGNIVVLEGMGERFNGKVFVSAVRHEIFGGTWLTTIQVGLSSKWFSEQHPDISQSPGSGLAPAINGLHLGKVVQIEGDEQDNGHRILVNIPYVQQDGQNDARGIWARTTQVFAGNERGMVFRPELEDEVLIGFINDDPRDAVILGALPSTANPTPLAPSDDNFEKGIYTLGKMQLTFDDDAKHIKIATESGNSVLLSEEEGGIYISDENDNIFELSSNGINLESLKDISIKATGDVEIQGKNVLLKGSVGLKAEGGSSAEFKASGNLKIQGATVNIN